MKNYTYILNEGFDSYFKKLNEDNNISSDYKIRLNLGNTIYFNKDICYDEETDEEIEVVQAILYNEILQKELITPEIELGDYISIEDIEEDDYTIISSGNDSNDYKILYNNIIEGGDIEDAIWDSILYIIPFDFEILDGSVRKDTLTLIFDTPEQADRALKIYTSNGISGRKEDDDIVIISDFFGSDNIDESLNESDEELPINYVEDDLRSDVYNALSDIALKYHQKGANITEDEMDRAIEWFQLHFWEGDDSDFVGAELNESDKKSYPFNFSVAAKKVAQLAVEDYKKSSEAKKFEQKLREFDEDLPVDKIMSNLCHIIYNKYFNAYKRPNRGNDYLRPFSSEKDMIDYYNKYGAEEFSAYDVKYRNGKVFVAVSTQFIDYIMYSYYVIYDSENPDKVYSCRSADFNARI